MDNKKILVAVDALTLRLFDPGNGTELSVELTPGEAILLAAHLLDAILAARIERSDAKSCAAALLAEAMAQTAHAIVHDLREEVHIQGGGLH